MSERAPHWDEVWSRTADHSWDEAAPATSLAMLDAAGVTPADAVLDVGGGQSRLVDALLDRGHHDLAVLDIADGALAGSRERLGARAGEVTWLATDLLAWEPDRTWEAWHDRAVFHFLTEPAERARYREVLARATAPGAAVVVGTFAEDGPTSCSGLPTARYDAAGLAEALGPGFEAVASRREEHATPFGTVQPFTWVALRRRTD